MSERVTILIPAFNEEDGVGRTIRSVQGLGLDAEILVVDDGSRDRTFEEASATGVRVLRHETNRGYGAALKTGIRAAAGEILVIVDADGTYPIAEIGKLLSDIDRYDMIVGSRTGGHVKIPLLRKPAKWMIARLANYLAEQDIPDLNSGLRVFRKEVAQKFFAILPSGFSFTTTITLAMLSNAYRVKYVPIDYYKRSGKSKIRPVQDTLNFIMLIVRTTMYFNPLRVFLPLSGITALIGIGVLLYSKLVLGKVMDISVIVIFSAALQVLVIGMLADLVDKRGLK